jgi:hypothetical protein
MIPRKEWEPHWKQFRPSQVVRQGSGCAVCTPVGQLLQYDRARVRQIAQAVKADYVWLGVTVVPLTPESRDNRPDDCCREGLAQERRKVLARSSALLVRGRDGEVVWQRDAREFERPVFAPPPKSPLRGRKRTPAEAVRNTAQALGTAFGRDHRAGLPLR